MRLAFTRRYRQQLQICQRRSRLSSAKPIASTDAFVRRLLVVQDLPKTPRPMSGYAQGPLDEKNASSLFAGNRLTHHFVIGVPRSSTSVMAHAAHTVTTIPMRTVFHVRRLTALKPRNHGDTNNHAPRTKVTHSSHSRNATRAVTAKAVNARPMM